MTDIFLSYAREDQERAKVLAEALKHQGWSVFWDLTIPPGQTWRNYIGSALEQARCIVVAWSAASVESRWVLEEADVGFERKNLVPVCFEQVLPPLGFRNIQAADLSDWDGATTSQPFRQLIDAIHGHLGSSPSKKKTQRKRPAEAKARRVETGEIFQDTLKDGSKGPEMVVIPAGIFRMGNIQSKGEDAEKPVHTVHINKPFALRQYPVTFEEYDKFAAATGEEKPNDEGWGRGRRPVIYVHWFYAKKYAAWLSKETGKRYRLPTEAEWEYACRASSETEYCFGDDEELLSQYAWYEKNSARKTHPVGEKLPNDWKLYDMHGNVWEWVEDCWHDSYGGAPDDGTAWENEDCGQRVVRGGSWGSVPEWLRSAARYWDGPDGRGSIVGFRIAQDL